MTTTDPITPPRALGPPEPDSEPDPGALRATSARDMLREALPLVGVIPVAGPALLLVVGPWVLLALMVAGPFVVVLTLVVLLIAAAALVGLVGAILAAPVLLARHLREPRAAHGWVLAPAALRHGLRRAGLVAITIVREQQPRAARTPGGAPFGS